MCHGFELHGNLIRHITKQNVSFSTTRIVCCRFQPTAATKWNSLVYVTRPTSLVFLDGFVSTVVYFNALRNGSVPFLNKFVPDMNTASYQHDGARPQARLHSGICSEQFRGKWFKVFLWICCISTLIVRFIVWLLEESFNPYPASVENRLSS
jgi:hypothetical protein